MDNLMETICFFKLMGKDGGCQIMISYIGANKHHRQCKFPKIWFLNQKMVSQNMVS